MIEIKNLNHTYKNRTEAALKDVNLHIKKGERIILLGPSGSGKSTLMKCINKLIEPVSGSIIIDKQDMVQLNSKETEKMRRKIGTIFQNFNLIENETVLKNVLNGRLGYVKTLQTLFNKFNKKDYEIVDDSLKDVGLIHFKNEKVCNLSGGQKQRVAIARALAQEPLIILADEPVSNLDPKLAKEVLDLLQKICKKKEITLIMSIHSVDLIEKYASKVIGILNGELIFNDSIEKLMLEEKLNERLRQLGYSD